jgi:uncharacterized membrane protein YphA (DoxX/SURF4 family)
VLRLGAGVSLFLLFGLAKVKAANSYFHTGTWEFVDFNRKVGLPAPAVVAVLQTLNESAGALLAVAGFQTRYAAGSVALGFLAATYLSIRMGEDAWLIAMFYTVMFMTLTLSGPGKLSIDYLLKSRRNSKDEKAATNRNSF